MDAVRYSNWLVDPQAAESFTLIRAKAVLGANDQPHFSGSVMANRLERSSSLVDLLAGVGLRAESREGLLHIEGALQEGAPFVLLALAPWSNPNRWLALDYKGVASMAFDYRGRIKKSMLPHWDDIHAAADPVDVLEAHFTRFRKASPLA